MPIDDEQLMERIKAGDEDAFDALVDQYHDPLRRHLMSTVRNDDLVGDLLQELQLRVWTRAEQWDGGSVKSWLYRIATNLALNHFRTVRRRREEPLDSPKSAEDDWSPPAWMVDSGSEAPEQAVIGRERFQMLRGFVDELSDEKRAVWDLIHEHDLDTASAAQTLGIPAGTVKSRLYHARQQLAREWNEVVKEWEKSE